MLEKIKNFFYKLLRKSEKYTKIDMVYLASGGFWLSVAKVVSTLSGFGLAIAFANLLPKEVYGTYRYILSILGILVVPSLGGINTALIRSVARGAEGSIRPALKTRVHWGLWGGVAALMVAGYYYWQGDATLTIAFLIAAGFMPIMDSFVIFDAFLQGKKEFKTSAVYNVIIKIVASLVMLVTLFLTDNVFLILLAYLAPYTLFRFIYLQITIRKHVVNSEIDSEVIGYGKHLTLMNVLSAIAARLDTILLWHYLNPVAVAVYSMSLTPVNQVRALLKSLLQLSIPKLAAQDRMVIKKTLIKKVLKFILVFVPGVVLFILIMPYLYKIFFPEYLESIKYAQYLVLTLIIFPVRLLSMSFIAQAKKKILYLTTTLNPALKILLVFLFLPRYGIMGLVLAVLIHDFIYVFVDYYFFKKL